jgi:hypothetical protein
MGSEMVVLASTGTSCTLASELTPNPKNITKTIIGYSNIVSFFISSSNETILMFVKA